MAYDPTTTVGQVRLLINDTSGDPVFDDGDINAFLTMEGLSVKRAAAQALDVIADDEALTAKVVTSQDVSTNGPAVAASLRARATTLREQAVYDLTVDDDEAVFELIPIQPDPATWWPV
jgi:hypothetical protein